MATATNVRFIEAALSKDTTRPNLCHIFSAHGQLMATDGSRLHMAPTPNGNRTDVKAYVDGYDGQFPDCGQVIPNPEELVTAACFTVNSSTLARLKAIAKAIGGKAPCIKIEVDKGILSCSATCPEDNFSAHFDFWGAPADSDCTATLGLNINYLIDAIAPWVTAKTFAEVVLSLEREDTKQGWSEVEHKKPYGCVLCATKWTINDHTAIIMPMRLN